MDFAELSVVEMAAKYNLPVEQLFALGDQLNIADQNQYTCLALEDAKAIILKILSTQSNLDTKGN